MFCSQIARLFSPSCLTVNLYRPPQLFHSTGANISCIWYILVIVIRLRTVVLLVPHLKQINVWLKNSLHILGYLLFMAYNHLFTGPSPVSTLTLADFTTTSLKISWAAVTPSSGYRVTISPDEGIQIQLPSPVKYSRTNLIPGRQYTFTVYTESGAEESLPTSDVFFTSKCLKFYLQFQKGHSQCGFVSCTQPENPQKNYFMIQPLGIQGRSQNYIEVCVGLYITVASTNWR